MNAATLVALASAASFIASVLTSAFISGARWGELQSDVKGIKEDVAEIKSAFRLTLKD